MKIMVNDILAFEESVDIPVKLDDGRVGWYTFDISELWGREDALDIQEDFEE